MVNDYKKPSHVGSYPEMSTLYEAGGMESSATLEPETGRESG